MTANTNSRHLPATPKQRAYLSDLMHEVYTPKQVGEYMRNLTKAEASAAIRKMQAARQGTRRS